MSRVDNQPDSASMAGMTPPQHARANRSGWQVALVVTAVALTALALIAYAAAGSYDGLWHLADAHHVPLPRLNPLGLDGGLVGIIALSIGLTWLGYNLPWLRLGGRLFAIGTIVANAAAGWPDPIAVLLRTAAPVLLVLITEAIYAVLLGRNAEVRDRIPLMRWVLAFPSTFRLWRRMVLWKINDYGAAIDMELDRLRAIKALTVRYGEEWESAAPADVVWMLTRGVKMTEALGMVATLTADKRTSPERQATATRKRRPKRQAAATSWRDKARDIVAANPNVRAAELALQCGVNKRTAERYLKPVRSRDQAESESLG